MRNWLAECDWLKIVVHTSVNAAQYDGDTKLHIGTQKVHDTA